MKKLLMLLALSLVLMSGLTVSANDNSYRSHPEVYNGQELHNYNEIKEPSLPDFNTDDPERNRISIFE